MATKRIAIKATVTSANIAYNDHAPSRSVRYTGTLETPEGVVTGVTFGRPLHEKWPPSIHVWPIKAGKEVACWREQSGPLAPWTYFYDFAEEPLLRTCDGTIVPRS